MRWNIPFLVGWCETLGHRNHPLIKNWILYPWICHYYWNLQWQVTYQLAGATGTIPKLDKMAISTYFNKQRKHCNISQRRKADSIHIENWTNFLLHSSPPSRIFNPPTLNRLERVRLGSETFGLSTLKNSLPGAPQLQLLQQFLGLMRGGSTQHAGGGRNHKIRHKVPQKWWKLVKAQRTLVQSIKTVAKSRKTGGESNTDYGKMYIVSFFMRVVVIVLDVCETQWPATHRNLHVLWPQGHLWLQGAWPSCWGSSATDATAGTWRVKEQHRSICSFNPSYADSWKQSAKIWKQSGNGSPGIASKNW